MEYSREKETVKRGQYIKEGMEQIHRTGDSYTYEDDLFLVCKEENHRVDRETFRNDLRYLVREDYLHIDGRRIYTKKIWRYQEAVVAQLMDILPSNSVPAVALPDPLVTSLVELTAEQRTAVEMALSHRISMILGGAGTGKSTLVTALSEHRPRKGGGVLSAPTGKAARNLTHRTRRQAHTVHSALGMRPEQNFLKDIEWACTELVVVDEASMMTLEMLAGILSRVPTECRVVLIGDPNQLLSVGAGNIMNDLLELGVPHVRLNICHRQREETALRNNVSHFTMYSRESELHYDESFRLVELPEEEVAPALQKEAVKRYLAGERVQVLVAFNQSTHLSVRAMNEAIAPLVNPRERDKYNLSLRRMPALWDGDRVIITKNDQKRNCSNGDVGILRIISSRNEGLRYQVLLDDGRRPEWEDISGALRMTPAYALTVHKSQGSEYDTILFPVSREMAGMLTRNLLYTAISRSKKRVILFGSKEALNIAMQKLPHRRRSMLVQKTRIAMCTIA